MRKKLPIFYSALLLTGVNLLLRFVSTSFQVYLSGRIGASGIGLLQLVLSVGMLAMTAGMAGVRTATMYLSAEELGRKRNGNVVWVLSGCFLYSILCSCAVAGVLYFLAPWLAEHRIGDIRTAYVLRLYCAFVPVSCLCGVMTGYFTAANRIGALAAVEIAEQLCCMALTLIMLQFYAGNDPVKACACVVLGSGAGSCVSLCALVLLRIAERNPVSKKIPVRSRLLHIALPLALADVLKSGINTAENLMVPKRLALHRQTDDPLSAFGTVCGMVFPVLMFPAAILFALAELLLPELARCAAAGSRERIRYLVRRGLHVALLYGCLFCGLMYLLAQPVCLWLYKTKEAAIHLRRFSLLIPMLYCDAITDSMTKGLGQQNACVRYNILTASMDVALLFLLLPRWGMGGYFFSFLITHLLNFILSLRRLISISKVKLNPTRPLLTLLATIAAVWAASYMHTAAGKAVSFSLLYGCLLCLMGVVGKADAAWLKGLIIKKRPVED